MRNVVLAMSLVVNLLPNIEARTYGENLIARLDSEIYRVNDLIAQIQEYYRDQLYAHPREPLPRNYESTLRRTSASIGKASSLMRDIEGKDRRLEDEVYEGNATFSLQNDDAGQKSTYDDRKINSGESTRRSGRPDDLKWKTNFYKALSRALKKEFKDEPIIQENISDGFVPPTWLKNRDDQQR